MTETKVHVNVGMPIYKDSNNSSIHIFDQMINLCINKKIDIVCDMSTDVKLKNERLDILNSSGLPFCLVPIYEY